MYRGHLPNLIVITQVSPQHNYVAMDIYTNQLLLK